CMQGLEFPLSF
nr:immunoglobulin light chain junction region [Macaca mulatta]MOW72841.1 immunoglobulin light chain junction region [Macaca mulatta]MOW72906.1 immunoglobulin light chain junction region [Macaca mulatta]MOW73456.1 immunoglobulin light chain junction region [Macaca mulatta]MOW73508.1 immunoglobulin light chain junction region [Macaca mulatta]